MRARGKEEEKEREKQRLRKRRSKRRGKRRIDREARQGRVGQGAMDSAKQQKKGELFQAPKLTFVFWFFCLHDPEFYLFRVSSNVSAIRFASFALSCVAVNSMKGETFLHDCKKKRKKENSAVTTKKTNEAINIDFRFSHSHLSLLQTYEKRRRTTPKK